MEVSKLNWWMWLRRELFVLTPFWMVSLHLILQLLDWATTLYIVQRVNVAVEFNPIIRFILEDPNGFWWFTSVKLFACIVVAIVIPWSIYRTGRSLIWRWLAIAYTAIVLNNLVGVSIVYMLS